MEFQKHLVCMDFGFGQITNLGDNLVWFRFGCISPYKCWEIKFEPLQLVE